MIKELIATVQKRNQGKRFQGGTVPIALTFRFVATCQAQSVSALEKSEHLCKKKIRQLMPLQCALFGP